MEPVAIIGMSIRFPGDATSPEAFWDMLVAGRSAWSEIPASRFNIDAWYHANPDRIDAVCVLCLITGEARGLILICAR